MNDKVKELVEWVAKKSFKAQFKSNLYSWETISEFMRDEFVKEAKQILSHPDLALIDREVRVPHIRADGLLIGCCEKCGKPMVAIDSYSRTVGISDMLKEGFTHSVIPLAEALKEA